MKLRASLFVCFSLCISWMCPHIVVSECKCSHFVSYVGQLGPSKIVYAGSISILVVCFVVVLFHSIWHFG